MSNQITISGITGNPPYDVYVCDVTNTYCYLITGSTLIPPTLVFDVPTPLDDVNNVLVKITDISGCTTFISYSCPPTPTPSVTPTPTPTPTPTNTCLCFEITTTGMTDGYFDYTDCFGVFHTNVFVNNSLIVYFCGQNISNLIDVTYTQTNYCVANTCP